MKRSHGISMLLAALMLSMSGCASNNERASKKSEQKANVIPAIRVAEIKSGVPDSTVLKILGEPNEITPVSNHEAIWKYVHNYTKDPAGDAYVFYNGPGEKKSGDFFHVMIKDNVVVRTWTSKSSE